MVESPQVKKLRDKLDAAMAKDKRKEAVEALLQLEHAEQGNPRWSHRLGDLQRRLGQNPQAIAAYERAVDRYAKSGFLARAVAMAKTISVIDPSRTDVLLRIQQDDARDLKRKSKVEDAPRARESKARISPGETAAPVLIEASPAIAPTCSLSEGAQVLAPAEDAADDEIRFVDQDDAEIAFDLTEEELEIVEVSPASIPPPVPAPDRAAERLSVLPLFALFAEVPREALLAMAGASELVELSPGEVVVRTGDPADSLWAIVEGSVRVLIPGLGQETRQPLREGEVFGEACLLTDEPRHADVVVFEQLTALRIPKHTLDVLVKAHAEVGTVLMNLLTRRLLVNLIKTSPMFAALDLDTRREVARLFEIRKATAGTVLVEAKKRGDGLYIPLTGKLEVTRSEGDTRVLSAGSIVGQGTFLGQGASTYTVRTLGDTVMLRLASSRLMELVTQYPTVLEQLSTGGIDDQLAG